MLVLYVWLADAQAPVWAYIAGAVATILWLIAPTLLLGPDCRKYGNFLWDAASLIMWPVILGIGIMVVLVLLIFFVAPGLLAEGISALLRRRHRMTTAAP